MNVLITGAGGFLGKYIAEEFLGMNFEVFGVDVIPSNAHHLNKAVHYMEIQLPNEALRSAIQQVKPDLCIHCAGTSSVAASLNDPRADFCSSVVLAEQLLAFLGQEVPECKCVFLSSAAVYGQPEQLPVAENAPIRPLSPYGYHKRLCELLFEQAARIQGKQTAILRIFSAYGPGLKKQVLWESVAQLATGRQVCLKGTGLESRDFVYASDIARAVGVVCNKSLFQGDIYNLGSGQETTIAEAVEELTKLFPGLPPPLFKGESISGDPQRWRADCSLLESLGFKSTIPMDQGLARLAEWAKNQMREPLVKG
jgi:UDP-glucose 4-epimerase